MILNVVMVEPEIPQNTGNVAKSSSRKRKMKKAAKKAANTINTIVDNMQDMIK